MFRDTWWGKTLRFIGIVLMALTGGFTLLGGIGTTCAALFPTRWDSMAPLAHSNGCTSCSCWQGSPWASGASAPPSSSCGALMTPT